jgi:hypothetical protein
VQAQVHTQVQNPRASASARASTRAQLCVQVHNTPTSASFQV